jgi:DNA-binding Xre family transcriptional regulator
MIGLPLCIIEDYGYICVQIEFIQDMKDLNRLKIVLVEKKRTGKWLAEQLGKNTTTVSNWCTNKSQPDLQTLDRIAGLLDVDVKDLLNSTREDIMYIPVSKTPMAL